MADVSESVVMSLAAHNAIVRLTGECTLSLKVLWAAIQAASEAKERCRIARETRQSEAIEFSNQP